MVQFLAKMSADLVLEATSLCCPVCKITGGNQMAQFIDHTWPYPVLRHNTSLDSSILKVLHFSCGISSSSVRLLRPAFFLSI